MRGSQREQKRGKGCQKLECGREYWRNVQSWEFKKERFEVKRKKTSRRPRKIVRFKKKTRLRQDKGTFPYLIKNDKISKIYRCAEFLLKR